MIYCIDFLIILIIPPRVCCCGSATRSCPTLCDTMDNSTEDLPVHHHLLEFAQTHVHWVSDAIQPSHPLLPPSPHAPSIFPSIRVFSSESALTSDGQVLELQYQFFNEYSGLISFRTDWFDLLAVQGTFRSLLHSFPPVTPWLIFSYCLCTLQNYKNQCSYLLLNSHTL